VTPRVAPWALRQVLVADEPEAVAPRWGLQERQQLALLREPQPVAPEVRRRGRRAG
jgi:hypothetical protein